MQTYSAGNSLRRRHGYTLIELLVVLSIMAALFAVVPPLFSAASSANEVRAISRQMTAVLRQARSTAVAARAPIDFTLDLEQRRYQLSDRPPVQLPADLELTMIAIVFFPQSSMKQSVDQHTTASRIPGLGVIVMAAGLGKRMKSNQVKVLHHVAGRPMVLYAVDVALQLAGHRIVVVVGHQSDRVRQVIESGIAGRPGSKAVSIVEQAEQLGTGHAVMQSRPAFCRGDEVHPTNYLILNGDTPLLKEETARELLRVHQSQGATVTILTATLDDPSGYGRVIRRQSGGYQQSEIASSDVLKIVEDRDATPVERATKEINVGT